MKKNLLILVMVILVIIAGITLYANLKTPKQINYTVTEFPEKFDKIKNNSWFSVGKENIAFKVRNSAEVGSINFLNSKSYEVSGKNMSAEINIYMDQSDLSTQLEFFILDIKMKNSDKLNINFINEGVKIDSDNISDVKFALVPNSRANEFRVNPEKNPAYNYFEIKEDEKTIFIKSSHSNKDSKGNTIYGVYTNEKMEKLIKEIIPE
ncbi:hypothetical protein [Carnobacterium maltaromaticum]|uniref:hypothetical protein n=1 Tax=Carnobacterium maltaromaticum TaxID=2751 RepID=UPI0012F9E1DB|nr:hypothetical protein [Carnobacterium maltaromaticum]